MKENTEELKFATVTPHGIVIPEVIDKRTSKGYINWGEDNKLPEYLWDNYLSCSNLQSIVNTITDFVIGEGVEHNFTQETLTENIQKWVLDYILFGGFAVEGIRNAKGNIVQLNYINVMHVRVNEALDTAYLSNNWGSWSTKNVIQLPLFDPNENQPHFVFYYRGNVTRNINPVPVYIASLKSIEILNNVKNFHLNNLTNGFTASTIINLNDGTIKTRELQEIKDQLE
jgi:capsid portal protein